MTNFMEKFSSSKLFSKWLNLAAWLSEASGACPVVADPLLPPGQWLHPLKPPINVDNVWSEHVWMYRQGYHRKFSLFSFFALILYIKNVNFHILICNNPPAKFLNLQHVFLLQLDQSNIISPAFYALYMLFIYIVQHLYNFSVHTRGERGLKESSYIHWRDIYL